MSTDTDAQDRTERGEAGGRDDGPDDGRDERGAGRRWLAAGICAGVIGLGVLGHFAVGWLADDPEPREPGPTGPLVETAPVRAVTRLTVAQTGFVRPGARLVLSAEVSGRVARVAEDFRVGRRIGEGEVVVELERARFEADVAAAEARLAGARARRDTASSNVGRQRQLDDEGFAVDQRLEEVETSLASAEAEVELAGSELELARIALEDTRIRAPYDALVSARDVSLGQIVGPGTSVGELVLAERAEIRIGLLPRQRALLGPEARLVGRPVDVFPVTGPRRRLATGRIAAVDPVLDPVARTLGIVVDVDDPFADGSLKVGELVEAVVPVMDAGANGGPRVFEVPARALKGADRLWVVERGEGGGDDGGGGELRAVDPDIVRRDDGTVQLASDALADGDRVLVTDVAAAVEGLAVRLASEAPEGGDDGEDGDDDDAEEGGGWNDEGGDRDGAGAS